MKKTLIAGVLLLVATAALALDPRSVLIYQAHESGDYYIGRLLASPSADSFILYDKASEQPLYGLVGSGLSWNGTTLSSTGGVGTVTSVTCGTGLSGGVVTTSGTCSLPSVGTAATYSGVTTDTQGRITAGSTRSFSYTTRALNTCFQVSSTRDAQVNYAVDIATSLSLTTGAQGTVYLRIYTNSGCTTGTQEVIRGTNGQTGTLTIGLALSQPVTAHLSGILPAGAFAQLVTELNVGTPTFTARPGQEVLL